MNIGNRINSHQERGRTWRSGPDDEDQRSIPGVTAAEIQNMDINRATEPELADIEDIGGALAHAIVAYRVHHGHFESWEDLRKVPGIQDHQVQLLQHAARIGGPGDAADKPTHRDDPQKPNGPSEGGLP